MIAIRVSLCLHEHMQIYCDPPDVSRRSPSSPVPATGSVFCGSVSSACAIYFFFGIHVKRKPTCKDADLELRVHWTNFLHGQPTENAQKREQLQGDATHASRILTSRALSIFTRTAPPTAKRRSFNTGKRSIIISMFARVTSNNSVSFFLLR